MLKKVEELGGNKMEWGKSTIEKGFYAIEELLGKYSGKYSVGDQVSMADLCLIP